METWDVDYAAERRLEARIRRQAKKDGLVAKLRKGKWYFIDEDNDLCSCQAGLTDEEALAFLEID